MIIFLNLKIFKIFLPLILSSEPWDTPIIKIRIKQINGEIVRLLNLKKIKERILQKKKK